MSSGLVCRGKIKREERNGQEAKLSLG